MTFVVGEKPEDYTWIDILGATIAAGSRRLFSVISKEQLEAEGILKDIQNRRARSEGAYPHPVRMDDSLGSICPDPLNISTRTPSVCLSPVNLKFDIGDD